MSQYNNYGSFYSPDIYLSNSTQKMVVDVSNNQSKYYAELAEQYKNEAKELLDSTRYYVETNSGVTEGTVEELATSLVNMIGQKATKDDINVHMNKKITNCFLEVPQRIQYTLVDGILTIKAGSVIIIPYGTTNQSSTINIDDTFINTDLKVVDRFWDSTNNRFFVFAELQNDIVRVSTAGGSIIEKATYLSISSTEITIDALNTANVTSVAADSAVTQNTAVFYNISENLVKQKYTGTITTNVVPFPFMLVLSDATYAIASVKQVFKGLSYIGSVLWADKGIKGLIPNGRNADGSLNNTEFTTNGVIIEDFSTANDGNYNCLINDSDIQGTKSLEYKVQENVNYKTSSDTYYQHCNCGNFNLESSTITSASFNNSLSINSMYDGQWVFDDVTLYEGSTPTSTDVNLDLSNYLPNDNYDYLVSLNGFITTASGAGNRGLLQVITDKTTTSGIYVAGGVAGSSTSGRAYGNTQIVVGTGRYINILKYANNTGNCGLYLKGYRRLGTNI